MPGVCFRCFREKTHSVYTGVTFVFIDKAGRTGEHCFYEKTDVSMYTLTEEEIDRYISSRDPMDKAGSYGYRPFCHPH